MCSNIGTRAQTILNLKQYEEDNKVELVAPLSLNLPDSRQYVLRMLIRRPFGDFKIPEKYLWGLPMIHKSQEYQEKYNIRQPFCYMTIRHGLVESINDDTWHVDGFSMNVTHIPEQNYIWTDVHPTQIVHKKISFPDDFDPFKHNIHTYLQDNVTDNDPVINLSERCIYALDPYIIHRRPPGTCGVMRTFIRISFTPMEIDDCNNTENGLIPTNYQRDGVKSFRDQLQRYSAQV